MTSKGAMVAVAALCLSFACPRTSVATVYGSGLAPCNAWLGARELSTDNLARTAIEQWSLGMFAGLEIVRSDLPLPQTDTASLWSGLDGYCRANPEVEINQAVMAVWLQRVKAQGYTVHGK